MDSRLDLFRAVYAEYRKAQCLQLQSAFSLKDTRREKSVEELNQLFYPNLARMTSGEKGELRGTEYLVCKQIIRDHDEFAGRRGCRINAEPAEGGGFTVYFTIPRR